MLIHLGLASFNTVLWFIMCYREQGTCSVYVNGTITNAALSGDIIIAFLHFIVL